MRELEILGVAAADGLAGPRPAKPGDGPKHANLHPECLNCGATMHGRYCADCGQTDDDHHRSIFHLIWEVVEDFTHLDGRLAKTIPPLFINPGKLVRDHFEGRRQRHVPPFRLFLVTLLLFMLSLEVTTHHDGKSPIGAVNIGPPPAGALHPTTPAPQAPAPPTAAPVKPAVPGTPPAKPVVEAPRIPGGVVIDTTDKGSTVKFGGGLITVSDDKPRKTLDAEAAAKGFDNMAKSDKPVLRWFAEHGRKALASREYFRATMFEWGHRLAILLLPIFAGMLTLFYFYKKRFYVYDHLVVAMHFLSFTFLLWGVVYLLPGPVTGSAMLIATIWTPVNLFMTLRGAYGSSIVGAAVKALSLWMATLFLFLALLMGVIVLALGSI